MTKQTASRATRYTAQGLIALGAIGLGVWGVMLSVGGDAQAQAQSDAQLPGSEASELSESTYFAVGRLRNELSLTSNDLHALGCDTATASACLSATLNWYRTNQNALHAARNNVLAAKKALYEANRAKPRPSATEFEKLAENLKDARAALATVEDQAAEAIGVSLSAEQRSRWAAARENRGMSGALRYVPGLTDVQKSRARAAQAEGRDLPGVIQQGELTFAQQQVAESVRAAMDAPAAAVRLAEADVLPMPEVLRLDREAALEPVGDAP